MENENASSLAPLAAASIVMAAALVSLVQRCFRERTIVGKAGEQRRMYYRRLALTIFVIFYVHKGETKGKMPQFVEAW